MIYSFCIPLKDDFCEKDIFSTIEEWINNSSYYTFENISLSNQKDYFSYICPEAELQFINYYKNNDPNETTHLYASRLSLSDEKNIEWITDFIFRLEPDNNSVIIYLYRGIYKTDQPAIMERSPHITDAFTIMLEHGFIKNDSGLDINAEILPLNAETFKVLNCIFSDQSFPAFPLIFVNCIDNPDMEQAGKELSRLLKKAVHVFCIRKQEDFSYIPECVKDKFKNNITICFPQIHVFDSIPVPYQDFKRMCKLMTDRIFYYSMSNISNHEVTWDQLYSVMQANSHSVSCEKSSCSSDADSVKEQGPGSLSEKNAYILVNEYISQKIKYSRKRTGLSQSELAELVHTTGLVISRLETGRTTKIKSQLLSDIESALGLENEELFRMEEQTDFTFHDSPAQENFSPKEEPAFYPRFCRQCGQKLLPKSSFCSYCGAKQVLDSKS